jgi:uncharacterized protein YacL (UPF0231 family)
VNKLKLVAEKRRQENEHNNGSVEAKTLKTSRSKVVGGGGASTVKRTHLDADASSAMPDKPEKPDKPDKPDKMEEKIKASVEKIRLILNKLMKTQSRLQKWMVRCDKTSNGLLGQVNFIQVVKKAVKKLGQEEVKENLMKRIWASVKEGSGEEVAWDMVEHEVVKRWVFPEVKVGADTTRRAGGHGRVMRKNRLQNIPTCPL